MPVPPTGSPELIFAVGAAAAIIGDTCGYWIGEKGGYPLLRRHGHYVRLDEAKLKVARYLFVRHGGKVVFFGRFISVLRTYAAFLAGMNKMHYGRFLLSTPAGASSGAPSSRSGPTGSGTKSPPSPARSALS